MHLGILITTLTVCGLKLHEMKYFISLCNSSIELIHAVYQEGKLCTTGKCILIHYNFETKTSVKIPDKIRLELENHLFTEHWTVTLDELELLQKKYNDKNK